MDIEDVATDDRLHKSAARILKRVRSDASPLHDDVSAALNSSAATYDECRAMKHVALALAAAARKRAKDAAPAPEEG